MEGLFVEHVLTFVASGKTIYGVKERQFIKREQNIKKFRRQTRFKGVFQRGWHFCTPNARKGLKSNRV